MPGVIKGGFGGYVYQNSFDEKPVMKTVYGRKAKGDSKPRQQEKQEKQQEDKREEGLSELDEETRKKVEAVTSARENDIFARATVSAEEARLEREQLQAEYEAMRAKYEHESELFVIRAKDKATEIYEQTKTIARQTVSEARSEAERITKKAEEDAQKLREEAKTKGYAEGEKQGYDEGYVKALKKCKDSLLELKEMSEKVTEEKSEILMKYERQLFDTIFEIVQKVTVNALGQKDKGVITRMIREAGKKYKTSKNVKLTLSKLDISDEAEIDEELLKQVFKSSENVEIELLDDAPAGTLMIDDGSDITDASISTQLKMVEQIGKGKYRDTNLAEMLQNSGAASKQKRAAKKKAASKDEEGGAADAEATAAENMEEEQAVPDVVYTSGKAAQKTAEE